MKNQKGIALIVSMVVLLVAALFGVSSFLSSQLEERMAGNHRFSVSALQAAEAGVSDMIDSVLYYNYDLGGSLFCDGNVMENFLEDFPNEDFPDLKWTLEASGGHSTAGDISGGGLIKKYNAIMYCAGSGHVLGYSRGVVLGGEYDTARLVKVEIIPPGYEAIKSMLANGDINIQGNSVIKGDVHANGSLSLKIRTQGNIKLQSSGSVTAHGTADFEAPVLAEDAECPAICTASNAPRIDVPDAQLFIDYIEGFVVGESGVGWSVTPVDEQYIKVLPHNSVTGDCSSTGAPLVEPTDPVFVPRPESESEIDLSDPETGLNKIKVMDKNYVYYCPGNLDTSDSFSGVTVVAGGNITHRGSATVAAENVTLDDKGEPIAVDTLVVSGGSITLDGATNTKTYAAFWSVGDFTQNGSSSIYGAIVAGGSIVNNGGINFTAIGSNTLFKPVSGRLEGWVELENPGDTTNLSGLIN